MDSKTKFVDGESLTADCFLVVGSIDDRSTWKLPWKFQARRKRVQHCMCNLVRFNEAIMPPVLRGRAWNRLAGQAWEHLGDISKFPRILQRLTADQIFDLERNSIQARALAVMKELEKEGLATKTFSA